MLGAGWLGNFIFREGLRIYSLRISWLSDSGYETCKSLFTENRAEFKGVNSMYVAEQFCDFLKDPENERVAHCLKQKTKQNKVTVEC